MAKGKYIPGLDCRAPAEKMVPLVLRAQLKAMCASRDTALDWKDPEGVHDMRVLSRRLRSAISDFKPYIRKSTLPRRKLIAIARRLGAVRDEDVTIPALEEFKSQTASPTAVEGIEVLVEEHTRRRKDARAALKVAIKRSAVSEFRKEFLSKLRDIKVVSRRKSGGKEDEETAPTFGSVGAEIIKDRLNELLVASPDLYLPLENKKLHELRILAKRLRYAIELFAICWGEELKEIAEEISLLQTSLGELHDCDVWIDSLGARLKQIARKKKRDADNIRLHEGAGWLLQYFARERMEHYREALSRWQRWEADKFLERLESVLDREGSFRAEQSPKVHAQLNPT